MRRQWLVAAALLALAGCTGVSGVPATGFINKDVERAYIPLSATRYVFFEGDAAAVSIGDGIAVTNAHTSNLLDEKSIIGRSIDYDLLYFHSDKAVAGMVAQPPSVGEHVVAYGEGDGALRKAEGVIKLLDAPVKPECVKCAVQSAFTFEGNAGPGFSGGPVLDAENGRLVGIVFGYVDGPGGIRTIYAYPMTRVKAELRKVVDKLPADLD
jgi:S1-C subfamily serine protease